MNIDKAIMAINELLITQDEINKKNELAIKILQDKVVELEVRQDKIRNEALEDPALEIGYPHK